MARDMSSPEKGRGFAFFNVGTIMIGGEFGERLPCRKVFGFAGFDRPVLVREGDPGFDVYGVHSPR